MSDFRLNRRLLFTAGSGVLGVTVLNTVTGCSTSDATTPTTSAPSAAAPPASAPAGGGNGVVGDWQRVNLSFVSAYLLIRGGEVAIVDTGTPGSETAIETALKAAGTGWSAVKHVILTHQHDDHAGGLAGIAPLVGAKLYAGEADISGITADKPIAGLKDGDDVFGLRIVGTPGHTLGHMAIFEPTTGVLVAGDALRNQNGLEGAAPEYTADMTQAAASVKKLAGLDVKAILPGHGDPLTTGAAEALKKLAASL
ncbi:MBL fold metallo-hydrolase [Actinoplanes sp. GCM10030250]|uniref:MBL fold metallo-hydrolase n=1 Tax=Actinoplanes sp. GCM10030250 TaxID=3273376 RepID=UPI00360CFE88